MNAHFAIVTCCASSLALALTLSGPSFAQDSGAVAQKVLAEDGKVVVRDVVGPAGASWTPPPIGAFTVVYYIKGGTVEYTYADGKKEAATRTTGTSRIITAAEKRPASIKNTGKAAMHIVTVSVK
jgi:hypothetical protein